MPIREDMFCKCGSLLSAVTFTCVRGEYCTAVKAKYTVNGKSFGTDYVQANMYWEVNGGVLMEKLDSMTPWHVLQTKETV